jgi:hypothetical protein
VSKAKWHPQRRLVVCLTQAYLSTDTMQPPLGSSYTLCARPAVWRAMGGNERSPEAGCAMTHAQFRQRRERRERPLQHPTGVIREVILIGQAEPEPPHEPGARVIDVTLGDTPSQVSSHPSR